MVFGDGDVEPAFGVRGGGDGSLNSIALQYPDGSRKSSRCLDLITGVPHGTVYHQQAGGGGGYGDPRKRPPAVVAQEVRNGIISLRAARELYGVVVDPDTHVVDEEATRQLRKQSYGF